MTTNETSTNEAAMTMEVLQRTAEILIHVADKGSVKYGNTINSYKQSPDINIWIYKTDGIKEESLTGIGN